MTEVQAHNKKNQQQHQNCQNCIRQKKENQTWIKIYQRLQQVQKNTKRLSHAVKQHKLSSETNRSFYRSYQQKIFSLPKVKKESNSIALQNAGFEIALGILQKQSKRKLAQENYHLKKVLNQMRKQRWQQASIQDKNNNNSSCFTKQIKDQPRRNSFDHLDQTKISQSFLSTSLQYPESGFVEKSQREQKGQSCQEIKENSSTQYSSFNIKHTKNSFDMSKYNDLNLWLYENQKHTKLQEELFSPKESTKNSFQKTSQILPSIRMKK